MPQFLLEMDYVISPVTVFDDIDNELFETKIGNKKNELCFSVWGETAESSRKLAEDLIQNLYKRGC